MSTKFVHNIVCAATGCENALRWADGFTLMTDDGLRLLERNGWREDRLRWVCGEHERKAK